MKILNKDELISTLTDILEGVKSGDTLEGSIEFLTSYDDADKWEVMASYRIGNLQGQGGMKII